MKPLVTAINVYWVAIAILQNTTTVISLTVTLLHTFPQLSLRI